MSTDALAIPLPVEVVGGGDKLEPDAATSEAVASVSSPTTGKEVTKSTKRDEMAATFLAFTGQHKKILNTMVRNNPSLLSGSFSVLVHNPNMLEFDNKRSYFFSRLHDRSQRQRQHYGTLQVNVRRQYVFEDSFQNLQRRSGDEIKYGKLSVKFYDEEGVDAGGVTREWFSVLARQMFNPGYALFQPQAADALTYQPNKVRPLPFRRPSLARNLTDLNTRIAPQSSSVNPDHLSFFQFVGRIIGKALHDQRILEAYFSRSVYKHMLGKPVDHNDLESIDPEYHKSLVWMLENDIDGILDLTFSVERDDFGVVEIVDLVEGGRDKVVTNENKAEYVRLIADQRLSTEIKDQIGALLKGLYEVVPKDLLKIFSEKELELLISGLPDIDVDEWRANTGSHALLPSSSLTRYFCSRTSNKNYTDLHNFTSTHPVIGYFWRAVRSFTMEERAKVGPNGPQKKVSELTLPASLLQLLQFGGVYLDLPSSYTSYEQLRKALLMAVTEGAGGFGFA
ncbi:hypothetical protein P7C70_g5684, partial [Phenoliferia sp. Uapishka_3]